MPMLRCRWCCSWCVLIAWQFLQRATHLFSSVTISVCVLCIAVDSSNVFVVGSMWSQSMATRRSGVICHPQSAHCFCCSFHALTIPRFCWVFSLFQRFLFALFRSGFALRHDCALARCRSGFVSRHVRLVAFLHCLQSDRLPSFVPSWL